MSFQARSEITGSVLTVRISGELDLSTSAALRHDVLREAQYRGITRVVVDAKLLEFVDSTGLGALVFMKRNLPAGVDFELRNVQGLPLRVIQITGLADLFEVEAPHEQTDGPGPLTPA